MLEFDEVSIQRLFGHEAAEDEDSKRLREYYFKAQVFQQIANDLPLRILVGHKGIGKSALFKIAMAEDEDNNRLAIAVQPNDLAGVASHERPFLELVRDWTDGLTDIIARKALASFGWNDEGTLAKAKSASGRIIDMLSDMFKERLKVDLTGARRAIRDQFLKNQIITVYLDDLDRGWQGQRHDVVRISALINAVRDICNGTPGIRFRIALRSDVYYLVRTSDESTDKIEGSVVWQSWTNHEILVLMVKRIETFFGRNVDESELMSLRQYELASYLDQIMAAKFQGMGHWQDAPIYRVLMSLIRKRPRDLVKLCTLAAREAFEDHSPVITTPNFQSIFEEYSQGRIQDTINEFRSELPDIERLIMNMKPTKKERTAKAGYVFTTDALIRKLRNIRETGTFTFANGKECLDKDLIMFLYKINFLTARMEKSDGIVRKYFEENRYIYTTFADFGFAWEIHPAYRWALQPDDPRGIFSALELSKDD